MGTDKLDTSIPSKESNWVVLRGFCFIKFWIIVKYINFLKYIYFELSKIFESKNFFVLGWCKKKKNMAEQWHIEASKVSKRTSNPIRQIVDGMKVKPNPEKELVSLSIGSFLFSSFPFEFLFPFLLFNVLVFQ